MRVTIVRSRLRLSTTGAPMKLDRIFAVLLCGSLGVLAFGLFASNARADYGNDWDSSGWVLLGEVYVHGHHERTQSIDVNARGRFQKVMVVANGDVDVTDLSLRFSRGDDWHPGLNHSFRDGCDILKKYLYE